MQEIIKQEAIDEDILNPDDDDLFSSDISGSSESATTKELFTNKNMRVKSDLSKFEINIISKLESYASITNTGNIITPIIKSFIELRASKERLSRKEFVEANKELKKNLNEGMLQNVLGK
jgi:hypothetical protein